MNKQRQQQQDTLNELRDAYRQLQAPAGLTQRIVARAGDELESAVSSRWRFALPAGAVAFASIAAALLVLRPVPGQLPVESTTTLSVPSLSSLETLMSNQPAVSMPGLADMSSMPTGLNTPKFDQLTPEMKHPKQSYLDKESRNERTSSHTKHV